MGSRHKYIHILVFYKGKPVKHKNTQIKLNIKFSWTFLFDLNGIRTGDYDVAVQFTNLYALTSRRMLVDYNKITTYCLWSVLSQWHTAASSHIGYVGKVDMGTI